ncbi:hypothetical protein ACR77J_07535 [Tissierella praeacuta]|uniref:hypothetical protein n=1 Tax=Tissierella praeacuta TaxID=43131 RepID=UPI003DA2666F
MEKEQILIAKNIYNKLGRQIAHLDCVISSRFDIPKTLLKLGIQTVGKDGIERPLVEINKELGRKIEYMEVHYE